MHLQFVAALCVAALAATPALAQPDHKDHHGADAAKPMDMSKMTKEEMHKHCSTMMGAKMQGAQKHDHSADKIGHAPATKTPTAAERKAMHDKCAAEMAEAKKP